MTYFLAALLIFIVAFAALAVGLLGKRCLRGSCGGTGQQCGCAGQPDHSTGQEEQRPDSES